MYEYMNKYTQVTKLSNEQQVFLFYDCVQLPQFGGSSGIDWNETIDYTSGKWVQEKRGKEHHQTNHEQVTIISHNHRG